MDWVSVYERWKARHKKHKGRHGKGAPPGDDWTAEETELIQAIMRWRTWHSENLPDYLTVFRILKALGYRKSVSDD